MFVAMGPELGVLCGQRIKLVHVYQTVVWQNCLDPDTADVIQTRSDQHVRDAALWHVLAGLSPGNVGDSSGMGDVHEAIVDLHLG